MPGAQRSDSAARRGRPRMISRERIAEVGRAITLPQVTVVRVAAELGVSHVGLYKHVAGLDELKALIADEIFTSWTPPDPVDSSDLSAYLHVFNDSLRTLVDENPGLAAFLTRPADPASAIHAAIRAHHDQVARAFDLTIDDANWMLSTVAMHCVALADTAYSLAAQDDTFDVEFRRSMHALIVGVLATYGAPR